jgi:poly(3-hydroxybutyrate) depolymerase
MYRYLLCSLVVLLSITINAQTINLRGKISSKSGSSVSNAIITLVKQGLKDTTSSDGKYSITKSSTSVLPQLLPQNRILSIDRGSLQLSLPEPSLVHIAVFDINGNLLKREPTQNVPAGFYRYNIEDGITSTRVLLIKATIGNDEVTFRHIPVNVGKYNLSNIIKLQNPSSGTLAKITAIDDTLKISAPGFSLKVMSISSYEQELDITLDSVSIGNAGPSAGCGKTTTLKGQSELKITSGGKERSYVIRIPDDYDNNHPYRFIVSIHPLTGYAVDVANQKGYEYDGLWNLANPKNGKGTTIFASPQGLKSKIMGGNYTGWSNPGGEDVEFIRSIITKYENELCIDTTRIFAEGFSMGGSMSYALACALPGKIRAVAVHSGGPMSGCDSTVRGPVAYFMTHGNLDSVCVYPDYGVSIAQDIASVNGCKKFNIANELKPTDASGKTPVCASFQDCKTGYPCRACIFAGKHVPNPGNNGWVADSSWKWFLQF